MGGTYSAFEGVVGENHERLQNVVGCVFLEKYRHQSCFIAAWRKGADVKFKPFRFFPRREFSIVVHINSAIPHINHILMQILDSLGLQFHFLQPFLRYWFQGFFLLLCPMIENGYEVAVGLGVRLDYLAYYFRLRENGKVNEESPITIVKVSIFSQREKAHLDKLVEYFFLNFLFER